MLSLQIKALEHYGRKLLNGLEQKDGRKCDEGRSDEGPQKIILRDWDDSEDEYFSDGDFSQFNFDDGTIRNSVSLLSVHPTV